jgi:DUF1009 family protein
MKIGLIAGNGNLPGLFVEAAARKGYEVVVVGHSGETPERLRESVAAFRWVKVGQVGAILSFFRENGVAQVAFAGGIRRPKLFGGVKLDAVGLKIVARARSMRDDALLREIAREFELHGLTVIAPTDILNECLAHADLFGARSLNDHERKDAALGWEVAERLGELDVGQAVVVFEGLVVALEGIEGTDAMIERAGRLIGGRGGVLVKIAKPSQDLRLDLPTVGEETIQRLSQAGITAMVLQENKSLILNPLMVAKRTKEKKLAVEVWNKK